MADYLHWNEQTITDFSEANIDTLYNEGYLFTRIGRGVMQQTRSVRVDLTNFELSSENRRILRKTESLDYTVSPIPFPGYTWEIAKMGKDFYETKFGEKTFTANKIKELMTDPEKSNFNRVFVYTMKKTPGAPITIGFCIALETNSLIHYSYPFYNLSPTTYTQDPNTGLGMMLRAILHAQEQGKKYVYIGSAQRRTDTYKFQFSGTEWFGGKEWMTDTEELKGLLNKV